MSLADDLYAEALLLGDDVPDLEELVERPAWMTGAACKGHTDLFFVGQGGDTGPARALCAACPVGAECLDYGLRERHGIWAGTSWRERVRMRRQERLAA